MKNQQQHHIAQRRQRQQQAQAQGQASSSSVSEQEQQQKYQPTIINHGIIKAFFVDNNNNNKNDDGDDTTTKVTAIQTPEDFFHHFCDKNHHYIPNRDPEYYEKIFPVQWSTKIMRESVKNKQLRHKVDLNIVRYDPKQKRRIDFVETMNLTDKDECPPLVTLEHFDQAISSGWSVRFLRPQEHSTALCDTMFKLEEELQCSCGINSYWTPGNSQGFAPHYDDVDVFLLQLEGQKHWRIYAPLTEGDWLSRVSSEDYKPEELGKPILDIVLKKGEMLYMPRGTVHQGDVIHVDNNKQHSLHVTFSAFQMHTWSDLLKETFNYRVEFAAANEVQFRHSLPLGWRTVMGSLSNSTMMGSHVMPLSAAQKHLRAELQKKMRGFFSEIHAALMTKDGALDKGVDAMAKTVLERRQPVPIEEKKRNERIANPTKIRLMYKESVRFVMMTDEVRLYHCGGNSTSCLGPREDRKNMKAQWDGEGGGGGGEEKTESSTASADAGYLRLDESFGPALAVIIAKSPNWVDLSSLPELGFNDKNSNKSDAISIEESRQMIDALLTTCCFEVKK